MGKTLPETEIGATTGLTVIALKKGDDVLTELSTDVEIGGHGVFDDRL